MLYCNSPETVVVYENVCLKKRRNLSTLNNANNLDDTTFRFTHHYREREILQGNQFLVLKNHIIRKGLTAFNHTAS